MGEIVLRSPCLFSGYDSNPEATAAALRDGWYFSGDLGYVADGELFVTGRAKDLVIVGGRNVYPQDIEPAVERGGRDPRPRGGLRGARRARAPRSWSCWPRRSGPARGARARGPPAVAQRTEAARATSGSWSRAAAQELVGQAGPRREPRALPRGRAVRERAASTQPPATAPAPPSAAWWHSSRQCLRVGDEEPILPSGLIDSFGMAELLDYIEADPGCGSPSLRRSRSGWTAWHAQWSSCCAGGRRRGRPRLEVLGDIPMAADAPRPAPRRPARCFYRASAAPPRRARGPRPARAGPGAPPAGGARERGAGRNVTLMPGAHLKNRERGRIVLHDGAKLDSGARVVAANDAVFELGESSALGLGTVVNAGATCGSARLAMTAAHCVINASEHGMAAGRRCATALRARADPDRRGRLDRGRRVRLQGRPDRPPGPWSPLGRSWRATCRPALSCGPPGARAQVPHLPRPAAVHLDMRYCPHCVLPDTKPHVAFDEAGVCSACRAHERKNDAEAGIDWAAREREFGEILAQAKARTAPYYDVLVPVSGGKDSITQVARLLGRGLRILAVNVDYGIKTEIGDWNLSRIPAMGASLITYRPQEPLPPAPDPHRARGLRRPRPAVAHAAARLAASRRAPLRGPPRRARRELRGRIRRRRRRR